MELCWVYRVADLPTMCCPFELMPMLTDESLYGLGNRPEVVNVNTASAKPSDADDHRDEQQSSDHLAPRRFASLTFTPPRDPACVLNARSMRL